MSSQRLFHINVEGKLKNIGRDFKSYDYGTVEACAELFLGESARKYQFDIPKFGRRFGSYYDQHNVTVFAECSFAAYESLFRMLRIAGVDEIKNCCFVVNELGKSAALGLHGVFSSIEKLDEYLDSVPLDVRTELVVRPLPFDQKAV
jgi:hypothetical protein